jgi:hypothetical protein
MTTTATKSEVVENTPDAKVVLDDLKRIRELLRHVKLVQEAAQRIGESLIEQGDSKLGRELIANSMNHDLSKFRGIEWNAIGNRNTGCSQDEKQLAILQHVQSNLHHPEYWGGVNDMPKVYLYEMVCDWFARSVEFGTDLRDWVKETAVNKYDIRRNSKPWKEIKRALDILLDQPF